MASVVSVNIPGKFVFNRPATVTTPQVDPVTPTPSMPFADGSRWAATTASSITPKYDATTDNWYFNLGYSGGLMVYRLDSSLALKRTVGGKPGCSFTGRSQTGQTQLAVTSGTHYVRTNMNPSTLEPETTGEYATVDGTDVFLGPVADSNSDIWIGTVTISARSAERALIVAKRAKDGAILAARRFDLRIYGTVVSSLIKDGNLYVGLNSLLQDAKGLPMIAKIDSNLNLVAAVSTGAVATTYNASNGFAGLCNDADGNFILVSSYIVSFSQNENKSAFGTHTIYKINAALDEVKQAVAYNWYGSRTSGDGWGDAFSWASVHQYKNSIRLVQLHSGYDLNQNSLLEFDASTLKAKRILNLSAARAYATFNGYAYSPSTLLVGLNEVITAYNPELPSAGAYNVVGQEKSFLVADITRKVVVTNPAVVFTPLDISTEVSTMDFNTGTFVKA